MILSLVLELRSRGVPVGTQELLALSDALAKGLHESSLDQFYHVARALLIHDETRLDDFDQVFGFLFRNTPYSSKALLDQLEEWLKNPLPRPELTEEQKRAIETLDLEELKRLFEERLREQQERHEGGNRWIGTGGTSPFGTSGYHPSGISLRNSGQASAPGGRSALRAADARLYRSYRTDLVLDVRQLEVALRKLRTFGRDAPATELDLEATIDRTARNFGDLEVVLRKPRHPDTRVILLMDVGGSMDPFTTPVSQLFSAAKRATHWKELRTYYFHNCVYGQVYKTEGLRDKVMLTDLFRECDRRYKVIFLGDAQMAPYELLGDAFSHEESERTSGLEWLIRIRNHFPNSIWLNPDVGVSWGGQAFETIARVFPMYPLTLAGLDEGMQLLKKR